MDCGFASSSGYWRWGGFVITTLARRLTWWGGYHWGGLKSIISGLICYYFRVCWVYKSAHIWSASGFRFLVF